MTLTNEQYERIARWLDGEAVALSPPEQQAAEQLRGDERWAGGVLEAAAPAGLVARAQQHVLAAEVRRDEAALAALLDVAVPREVIDRAFRRVAAELARPRRRRLRIGVAAASLAAAAAVLLAFGLGRPWLRPEKLISPSPQARVLAVPVEVLSASVRQPHDPAVEMVADEIDRLEVELLAMAPPSPLDVGIDHAERAVAEFWLDDVPD